jgi:hypothetical protein
MLAAMSFSNHVNILFSQGGRGRKRIEKDPNAEDKEKPYVCEGKSPGVLAFIYLFF